MGTLAHLVPAQSLIGALGEYDTIVTEGATWRWDFYDLLDADSDPIPQAAIAALTCDCKVIDPTGAVIFTPTFAATGDGAFSLTVDESLTANTAGGDPQGRLLRWQMSLDDGTDVVQFWTLDRSPFLIVQTDLY